MTDCVLITELGPNLAALVEALWALARQRDLQVRAAFVLVSPRGEWYLHTEVLAPGAAYEQLHAVLGDDLVPREKLCVTVVRDASGAPIDDELTEATASVWNEARWQNARAALRAAGDGPIVFALAGGRRRTAGAMTTVLFQLLARPQDVLVDVRVGDRRVEGAMAGFYFPEQREQQLVVESDPILARDVAVHLVEVQVPRLGRLLGGRELSTWADALAAGQRAIDEVPSIALTLDIAAARVLLDDTDVKLAQAELIWFAALVIARKTTEEGWLRNDDRQATLGVLQQMRELHGPKWKPSAQAWKRVLEGTNDADDEGNLSKYRSTAVRRFEKALKAAGLTREAIDGAKPVHESRVIDGAKVTLWRLPIAASAITILRPR